MALSRRRMLAGLAGVGVLTAGCGKRNDTGGKNTPKPAAITIAPGDGSNGANPLAPATVRVSDGTLDAVTMVSDAGAVVVGVLTPDKLVWKTTEPLGYGRTYTVTATASSATGKITATSKFTTLQPSNQTKAYLTTTAGHELTDGGTYGVGLVIVAHFDEPIADRAAAEHRLSVTTDPPVTGAWNWIDHQNAHWRPRHYHASGTKITVAANIYGIQVGDGLYGQEDSRISVVIGDAHVSIADDDTKQVQVFENGNLVRSMPTSMGRGGSEVIAGNTISFWTQPGVYTVMDKANPVIMDSSTYGLPINSRLGYREAINWATRISTDGVYLHELDSTVWAQGNADTSHGCLNLNGDNAKWFYDFSVPGDVVEVCNTGGDPLQVWQNGDWSVSWEQWRQGSALA